MAAVVVSFVLGFLVARKQEREDVAVRSGHRRVYFEVPEAIYTHLAEAARRHDLDVGGYILARGLAEPVVVKGDFVAAPREAEKK